jgi:hypothetical protein
MPNSFRMPPGSFRMTEETWSRLVRGTSGTMLLTDCSVTCVPFRAEAPGRQGCD